MPEEEMTKQKNIPTGKPSQSEVMGEKEERSLEVPRTSLKKKRAPQSRDRIAARLKQQGSGLGSGRTYDRARYVIEKADELKARGYAAQSAILLDTLNCGGNIRGTYEIARLPEDDLFALCEVVMAHKALNLLEACKLVRELMKNKRGKEKPVTLSRARNGMYRLTSRRNTASVLLSAQDLIELSELLLSNMAEFHQKTGEVPGSSSGEM